MTDSKAFPFIW